MERVRAGHRFSSMSAAWMICFSRRTWSSVSRMVKSGLRSAELGVAAQDAGGDGVEGAEPEAGGGAADQALHATDHLARRLVGEGDREHLPRPGPAGGEDVGEARGEHAGLAGAGAGQHQERAVQRFRRLALLRVQAVEIGRGGRRR